MPRLASCWHVWSFERAGLPIAKRILDEDGPAPQVTQQQADEWFSSHIASLLGRMGK